MSSVSRVSSSLFFVIVCLALMFGAIYHQRIFDQFKVWSYEPSHAISQLAERSGFSGEGKFYFYVTKPQLESASEFNDDCRRVEKGSPILGCYIQGADTIHIYNIDNPDLDGIKEVTAAHEMLHAVFARLSESERGASSDLARQLEEEYARQKTPKLEERMAYYERTQPGARINELHSIAGTEFGDISDDLEKYYSRYFTDRQKVVALHESYSQKFESLENELESLSAAMKQQMASIDQKSSNYEAALSSFNGRVAAFNARADRGDFSSQAEFNRQRAGLLRESASLEGDRLEAMQLVDEYNKNVERINELGGKMNQLNRSLDSLQEVGS